MVTVEGSYTAVNHKVTVLNGPYFTHLVSIILRPFLDVSYTVTNSQKWSENQIFDHLRHGKIRP